MKTTQKQFKIFQDECEYWIKEFGLTDYRIEIFWEDVEGNVRAQTIDYDPNLMSVDIIFPKKLADTTDTEKIKQSAFHEVCEVLLMKLRRLADDLYTHTVVDREVHTIIRRLEHILFDSN